MVGNDINEAKNYLFENKEKNQHKFYDKFNDEEFDRSQNYLNSSATLNVNITENNIQRIEHNMSNSKSNSVHDFSSKIEERNLLANTSFSESPKNIGNVLRKESEEISQMKNLKFCNFVKKLSLISFPTTLYYLFVLLMQTINLIFIGAKYNSKEMAESISACNLYINCTLFAVTMGIISGMDALCSNAYALKKYYLMGLYVHRARIVTYFVTFIIIIIHIFTAKYVFNLFNLSEKVKADAVVYVYYSLIYAFFDVQSSIVLRYLNVIRKSYIGFIILAICILFHPLWNYIFIYVLDWGLIGSAWAFNIGRIMLFILGTGYLWIFNPVPEASFSINKKCFNLKGLWDFFKYSIGFALLMCAEWWPFELLTLLSSFMSEIDYNVHIYSTQINSLLFSIGVGISLATTIYISDYIAKCDVKIAKKAALYATIYGMMCIGVISVVLFFLRKNILRMFTQNNDIIERGQPVIFYLCFTCFLDTTQYTLSSVLRGLGKQTLASIMGFIQFYLIMLSLAYYFGIYLKMGVTGIWLAILIGDISAAIIFLTNLLILDWHKVKEETLKRLENDNKTALLDD